MAVRRQFSPHWVGRHRENAVVDALLMFIDENEGLGWTWRQIEKPCVIVLPTFCLPQALVPVPIQFSAQLARCVWTRGGVTAGVSRRFVAGHCGLVAPADIDRR